MDQDISRASAAIVVADAVFREDALPEAARHFAHDTVTLGWEDRTHVHGRRRTDGGIEFGTALPRGTVLRAGDCFLLEPARVVVAVVERPEPVFVLEPRTPQDWALFAYHIGNRHQPVMIAGDHLVCPDLPGVEQMLRQHQIPYSRAERPFTPAAVTVGHRH